MKSIKKLEGFTLVEMLVVIAIISILAAALFPAINNAMGQASATAMKNKGRGIWTAITSANMEREPLNLGTLWPLDLKDDDDISFSSEDSGDYFTYLLSDEESTGKICDDVDDRVVADLTPESLIASGIAPATSGSKVDGEKNCAWKVTSVSDNSPGEFPFLFSRNVKDLSRLEGVAESSKGSKIDLTGRKPFGKQRAVWVVKGGGVFDARQRYFTDRQVMGVKGSGAGSDEGIAYIKTWKCGTDTE